MESSRVPYSVFCSPCLSHFAICSDTQERRMVLCVAYTSTFIYGIPVQASGNWQRCSSELLLRLTFSKRFRGNFILTCSMLSTLRMLAKPPGTLRMPNQAVHHRGNTSPYTVCHLGSQVAMQGLHATVLFIGMALGRLNDRRGIVPASGRPCNAHAPHASLVLRARRLPRHQQAHM